MGLELVMMIEDAKLLKKSSSPRSVHLLLAVGVLMYMSFMEISWDFRDDGLSDWGFPHKFFGPFEANGGALFGRGVGFGTSLLHNLIE